MATNPKQLVYAGIREYVVAMDIDTGDVIWQTELKRQDYTNVLWDGEALYASNAGEVSRLDPRTGRILWTNELKGMGRGLVSLASGRRPSNADTIAAAKAQRDAQAAAAAAS